MKILTMGLLLATMLLTGLPSFGAQVSIGIRIGPPPPPRVVYVLPANPGPEYVWVDGYWYPVGNHWKWHKGYWEGDRGRIGHDHHWDRDRGRDYREKERDREHDRR